MFSHCFPATARRLLLALATSSLLIVAPIPAHAQSSPFAQAVIGKLGATDTGTPPVVTDIPVFSANVLREMYLGSAYEPLWSDAATADLAQAIEALREDGLDPLEYRFSRIAAQLDAPDLEALDAIERAEADILLTEAFLRAAYQLYFGKVDPQHVDPNINFIRADADGDAVARLFGAIRQGTLVDALDWARADAPAYARMRGALARYQGYADAGGWMAVPSGPTLELATEGERVQALRLRLVASEDLDPAALASPPVFDQLLEEAVRHFQRRHGLAVDGRVGPNTLRTLNVSVESRIDQLRINLERLRWILHERYDEFIIVNIADFQAAWFDSGVPVWVEDVQVGKEYTQTPVFGGRISYLEFNPTWTIPPGILRRTIIPGIRRDPQYLQKKGYLLLTQAGDEVDPDTVDWASLEGFPYLVRQPAGPDNALGQVKFIFPNPHFVFLHDTNHQELFDRTQRTFSSGCIRVRNPFVLAQRLLAPQGWTRERIDQLLASGETKRIYLDNPMRVFITYFTARVPMGTEEVLFRPDVYGRDAAVLASLNGEFIPAPGRANQGASSGAD